MNQAFRLNFDLPESNKKAPGQNLSESNTDICALQYAEVGHVRNLCFVFKDGKRLFLNYSYLVSGEYRPEESSMTLEYTSHIVVLKGIHLEGLYYEIMQQLTKQIVCTDTRYNAITENGMPAINEIQIIKSNS